MNMEQNAMTASPQKSGLAMALAKVQGAIQNPKKDTANPFFKSKYADLAAVWDSVRPHLAANDLAFVQMPSTDGNKVTVTGKLLHASGECLESAITGQAKDAAPQSIGSCITYLRRYQLSAMLGIAAEEDDDGNAATHAEPGKKPKTAAQERPTFANGIPFEKFQADQEAKAAAKPAPPTQIDHGSFEDKIRSARIKSEGKYGNGKPWTLYGIETEGHGEFSTFELSVYTAAMTAHNMDHYVMIDTEPTPKGPKVTGIREIPQEAVV